jgi:3D (Asp-Asp-Asp) domain-containing protein
MATQDAIQPARSQRVCTPRRRGMANACGAVGLCALVFLSAVVTKEAVGRARMNPLASVSDFPAPAGALAVEAPTDSRPRTVRVEPTTPRLEPAVSTPPAIVVAAYAPSAEVRYFNARPVRPARTITMLVTAYSPDARSCGPSADGITSSVHSVQTNAMKLVAADSRVLPLGSMVSVPGYDDGRIVPVLDRGGKIKGKHIDVLFPTDAEARAWGTRRLEVTVWEYADNLPADDFRAIRDSRN